VAFFKEEEFFLFKDEVDFNDDVFFLRMRNFLREREVFHFGATFIGRERTEFLLYRRHWLFYFVTREGFFVHSAGAAMREVFHFS